MYHSGFAHTEQITYNSTMWNGYPINSSVYFYRDDSDYYKYNNIRDSYKYSIGIYGKSVDSAYYQRNFSTVKNTNYVVNAMVKSSFVTNASKPFTTLPAFLKVIVGSETHTNIQIVGIKGDWTEISVGFNSGNNTSVTIKIGADFTEATSYETVLFSGIRIDKLKTTKLLFLAYKNVSYTGEDGFVYDGHFGDDLSLKLSGIKQQFEDVFRLISNGKVVPEITIMCINSIDSITVTDTNYGINLKDVVSDVSNLSEYDCVCVYSPLSGNKNGRNHYMGIFTGIYDSNSYREVPYDKLLDQYDSLINGVGYICYDASFVNSFNPGVNKDLDGYVHEFIHYLQSCASHLDRGIRKFYPGIDDLDSVNRNEYYDEVKFKRDSVLYNNYEVFYEHLRDNSTYDYLFTEFTRYGSNYKMKYRWYYDVLNAQVQDCYRYSGVWGMYSSWVEIGCEEITYMMAAYYGVKPGVYEIKNAYSSLYLDSNNVPTQQMRAYDDNQYWEFKACGDGSFEIIPLSNYSYRLTAESNYMTSLSYSSGATNQKWTIKSISGKYYIYSKSYSMRKLQLASQSSTANVGMVLGTSNANIAIWDINNVNVMSDTIITICSQFSGKFVSAITNGTYNITQNEYKADLPQIWYVKQCEDGYVQLIPLSNMNVCLTANSINTVDMSTNSEAENQKWIISILSNDSYRITPKIYSTKCLDVRGPSVEDGAALQLWKYQEYSDEMKWIIAYLHKKGTVVSRLRSCFSTLNYMKHNEDISIQHDVVQHSRVAENQYSGWSTFDSNYIYSSHFMWEFELQQDGFYKIKPLSNHRLYLTAACNSTNPAKLSLDFDKNQDSQKWVLIHLPDGKYRISPKNNITKAIVLFGPIVTDDAWLQLWTFNTTPEVRWYFEEIQAMFEGTTFHIRNKMNGQRYLDCRDNNSTAPYESQRDDVLTIYETSGQNEQIWELVLQDGWYRIVSSASSGYAAAGIVSSRIGTDRARKKIADNSDEQQWIIEKRDEKYCFLPKDNPDKCICVSGPLDRNGQLVHLFTYNQNDDLNWNIPEV